MRLGRLVSSALLAAALVPAAAAAGTKLLRFPDVHGDQVVFSYGGDLWKASTAGGLATRLTAHPGVEVFAKFSPDGRSIAFTGQYDGDEQVYVIPADGGEPRQLTFYPAAGPLPLSFPAAAADRAGCGLPGRSARSAPGWHVRCPGRLRRDARGCAPAIAGVEAARPRRRVRPA